MRHHFYLLFIACFFLLWSCKKENLPPGDVHNQPASFTLLSPGSSCFNAVVQGTYTLHRALDTSHKIFLDVNVTLPGRYSVSSAVAYGMQFSGSGTFLTTGNQKIELKGAGKPIYAGTLVFYFSAGISSCSFIVPVGAGEVPGVSENDHLLFGNPSRAALLIDSATNYLMRKSFYALSNNRDKGIPNWVSWHLFSGDLGSTPRQDDFRPDNSLPAGWYQVPENAFSGSGFDRGHNVASADRTGSLEANSSTFLMTNIIPQAPSQNQEPWAKLEDSLRRLVNAGNEIYIIMGTRGIGGTGNNGFATSLHNGRVTVPASIWKIALVLPNGTNDSNRVNTLTRLIAVDIPNNNNVSMNWKNYRVTVDAIEAATGYDFLDRLPAALQGILEARVDVN